VQMIICRSSRKQRIHIDRGVVALAIVRGGVNDDHRTLFGGLRLASKPLWNIQRLSIMPDENEEIAVKSAVQEGPKRESLMTKRSGGRCGEKSGLLP